MRDGQASAKRHAFGGMDPCRRGRRFRASVSAGIGVAPFPDAGKPVAANALLGRRGLVKAHGRRASGYSDVGSGGVTKAPGAAPRGWIIAILPTSPDRAWRTVGGCTLGSAGQLGLGRQAVAGADCRPLFSPRSAVAIEDQAGCRHAVSPSFMKRRLRASLGRRKDLYSCM